MAFEVSENKKRKVSPEPDVESSNTASSPNLLIKRLSDKAKLPTRGSALAAGYDLYR
jgi:dUTP pyrophosphatase